MLYSFGRSVSSSSTGRTLWTQPRPQNVLQTGTIWRKHDVRVRAGWIARSATLRDTGQRVPGRTAPSPSVPGLPSRWLADAAFHHHLVQQRTWTVDAARPPLCLAAPYATATAPTVAERGGQCGGGRRCGRRLAQPPGGGSGGCGGRSRSGRRFADANRPAANGARAGRNHQTKKVNLQHWVADATCGCWTTQLKQWKIKR